MVMRRAVRGTLVDVPADAEAQVGVLVEHLARVFAFLAIRKVSRNESIVAQGVGNQCADRISAFGDRLGCEFRVQIL